MPLELPVEESCSFCDYLAGRRPYTILERNKLTAVLVTREQRGRGHVLVIPIEHRVTILDLTAEESAALMGSVGRVARALAVALDPDGIAVWQNNGVPANQSIPHVHVHVAGTLPEGGTERGDVPNLTVAATDQTAATLRPHLDSEDERVRR